MANPLFTPGAQNGSNFFNMINQFRQFRSTFKGDPKAKVQELLNSGQMTQEQFDTLQQMAKGLTGVLK